MPPILRSALLAIPIALATLLFGYFFSFGIVHSDGPLRYLAYVVLAPVVCAYVYGPDVFPTLADTIYLPVFGMLGQYLYVWLVVYAFHRLQQATPTPHV